MLQIKTDGEDYFQDDRNIKYHHCWHFGSLTREGTTHPATLCYTVILCYLTIIMLNQCHLVCWKLTLIQSMLLLAHLLVPISGRPCRPRTKPAASQTGSSSRTSTGSPGVRSVSGPGTEPPSFLSWWNIKCLPSPVGYRWQLTDSW